VAGMPRSASNSAMPRMYPALRLTIRHTFGA
jgi:hypothetical protein